MIATPPSSCAFSWSYWQRTTHQAFQFPVISQRTILGFFLRCGRLLSHLIVGPNWVVLHFEPENVNFWTSSVNLWHLGVDLIILRCKKRFRGGSPYTPKKLLLLILGTSNTNAIVHTCTPFTGIAYWKLKGLHTTSQKLTGSQYQFQTNSYKETRTITRLHQFKTSS
jgi:hypothetical protein